MIDSSKREIIDSLSCEINELKVIIISRTHARQDTAQYEANRLAKAECIEASQIVQTVLDSAIVAIGKGEYELSLKLTEVALQDNNDSGFLSEVYFYRSVAFSYLDDFDSSLINTQRALELDPKNVDALTNLANAFTDNQVFDSALHYYNEILFIDPRRAWTFSGRGDVFLKTKQYEKAAREYGFAIKFYPAHSYWFFNCGYVFLKLERYDSALAMYQQALALESDKSDVYVGIGNSFMMLGTLDSSIHYYQEALELNSRDWTAFVGLGSVYFTSGMYNMSKMYFDKVLLLSPNDPTATFWTGVASEHLGEEDRAIEKYLRFLELVLEVDTLRFDSEIAHASSYLNSPPSSDY